MTEQLTRAQIAALTPEQLRLAVAEHMMGYTWHTVEYKHLSGGIEWNKGDKFLLDGEGRSYIPNYPADIAAAWLVAEKMQSYDGVNNLMYDAFCHQLYKLPSLYTMTRAEASTAICRAALLATVAE